MNLFGSINNMFQFTDNVQLKLSDCIKLFIEPVNKQKLMENPLISPDCENLDKEYYNLLPTFLKSHINIDNYYSNRIVKTIIELINKKILDQHINISEYISTIYNSKETFLEYIIEFNKDDLKNIFCSISLEVMKDPVIDPDGNTYDRCNIVEWININNKSPITRNALSILQLRSNKILKSFISLIENTLLTKGISDPFAHIKIMCNFEESKKQDNNSDMDILEHDNTELKIDCFNENSEYTAHITLIPPTIEYIANLNIIAIVDISGSMKNETSITNSEGLGVSNGLSILVD